MSDFGTPEEIERAYAKFVGHWHSADVPEEGFGEWVRNLHDVYLNVEAAWLASLHVPPSEVEEQLEEVGGSRRQRLARFLARDMWVLWEAWDRRPQYHPAFEARAPEVFARLRELEDEGRSLGWFKRVRSIRDYMNHRDKRDYDDPGREELPDDAIRWLDHLRTAFSGLLLAAMGMPSPPWHAMAAHEAETRNSSLHEIAVSAVDDLLVGTAAALGMGAESTPDATALVAGHFGRAFTAATCASPGLWSECLTALIRRCVVAWERLGAVPELREMVRQMELDPTSELFLLAVVSVPTDEEPSALRDRSRLAVHRVTDWFNGHGDLVSTIGAAVSVAGVLVSTTLILEDDEPDIEAWVRALGTEADALLDS